MKIPILVSEFNGGKILTVNVIINNINSNFLLDTGASISVIDLRKLYKYTSSKPVKVLNISSIYNDIDTYQIKIQKFIMGKIVMKEKLFHTTDLINLNNTFSTNHINVIDGILGNDIIFDAVSKIDIDKKIIILK